MKEHHSKFINTKQLRKLVGAQELRFMQNSAQRGAYHFRFKKFDIHLIGRNEYMIEPKKKLNDFLFKP